MGTKVGTRPSKFPNDHRGLEVAFDGLLHRIRRGDIELMPIALEIDREEDGRWIAEIPTLPGCLASGATREEAVRAVEALAKTIQ